MLLSFISPLLLSLLFVEVSCVDITVSSVAKCLEATPTTVSWSPPAASVRFEIFDRDLTYFIQNPGTGDFGTGVVSSFVYTPDKSLVGTDTTYFISLISGSNSSATNPFSVESNCAAAATSSGGGSTASTANTAASTDVPITVIPISSSTAQSTNNAGGATTSNLASKATTSNPAATTAQPAAITSVATSTVTYGDETLTLRKTTVITSSASLAGTSSSTISSAALATSTDEGWLEQGWDNFEDIFTGDAGGAMEVRWVSLWLGVLVSLGGYFFCVV